MTGFLQSLSFTTPVALAALILLPVIWWLLRFTPPKPQTIKFPPLRLLMELVNRDVEPDKTPWWLMVLRLAIAALIIFAVAHPYLAPGRAISTSQEPLLIIVDDTWAAAKNWNERRAILEELVSKARQDGVTISLATTAPTAHKLDIVPGNVDTALMQIAALEPKALEPDRASLLERLKAGFASAARLHVVWLTDGMDQSTASQFAQGLASLAGGHATVEALLPEMKTLPVSFAPPTAENGQFIIHLMRPGAGLPRSLEVRALATNGRSLAEVKVDFTSVSTGAQGRLELPVELRNEVQRLEISGERNAAATYLFDDRWRRKTIALQSGGSLEDAQPLLSPLYYVSRALEPYAEISEPQNSQSLKQQLDAGLSMLVLADIGVMPAESEEIIKPWLERGGVLLRFAGPRMAAAHDDLLPVAIREGGRALGSALSWETPQKLQEFTEKSPFAGLELDGKVAVSRQVLAEPDNDLPDRVWASLADGTPLVTARREGKGLIVLFHVTANAEWSNLPLSGLFVEMLRRIADLAPGAGGGAAPGGSATVGVFNPRLSLSGTGELMEPTPDAKPISLKDIEKAKPAPETPAGLYNRGSSERAINLLPQVSSMTAIASLPAGVVAGSYAPRPSQPLAPLLFTLAFLLFLGDTLASLVLGGGLHRLRGAAIVALLFFNLPGQAVAADDFAMKAAEDTRLAYVVTGDASVDATSEQGLKGLSLVLADRTSVSPADPMAINLESDEIVFFPLIYWPVVEGATAPSAAALAKMADYMKNGGTIFFDLRDDQNGFEDVSPSTEALRRILEKLDIPPLEPVPDTHVLTKSFYLLKDFPGRYENGPLWVERGDASTSSKSDGVSSIIIGSNDYAAAWATDANGNPLYAVIGNSDRQREMAYRAGINIVMYALTGNYKADQVHVPALLERLGQ